MIHVGNFMSRRTSRVITGVCPSSYRGSYLSMCASAYLRNFHICIKDSLNFIFTQGLVHFRHILPAPHYNSGTHWSPSEQAAYLMGDVSWSNFCCIGCCPILSSAHVHVPYQTRGCTEYRYDGHSKPWCLAHGPLHCASVSLNPLTLMLISRVIYHSDRPGTDWTSKSRVSCLPCVIDIYHFF